MSWEARAPMAKIEVVIDGDRSAFGPLAAAFECQGDQE